MSMEVIIAAILAIGGALFGYKQWARDKALDENKYKRKKQALERAKAKEQRYRERFQEEKTELTEQEKALEYEIKELNKEIIKEKDTHEENLDRLDEMSSDELDDRANELLYG